MCLGIPGQVVAITDAQRRLATVDIAGVQREVCLACVCETGQPPQQLLGAWVLVHVGFAMARISDTEAQRTLELLEQLVEAGAPAAGHD